MRVPANLWKALRGHLLAGPDERMAYLLARASVWTDPWDRDTTDLFVRRAIPVPEQALLVQSSVRVEVSPAFCREILRACYESGMSLIDVHTHPFSGGYVAFSAHDVANMGVTHREFAATLPQDPPARAASLVLGRHSVAGSWLDPTSGHLAPIDSLHLISDRLEEVELCT